MKSSIVIAALLLTGCVQTNTLGDVVTVVHRKPSGDLAVETCTVSLRVTYVLFPVGVDPTKSDCAEKVIR